MSEFFGPKDIFVEIYSPNKKIVEISIKLENLPGAIEKISNELSKHGVNILSGFHAAYPNIKEAIWSFFADFTNANIEPEDLFEKIKNMNVTLDIKINKEKINGLIVDNLHFPLLVSNERSLTFRVSTLADMMNRLYKVFGSGGATILHEMGMELGEKAIKKTSEKYNLKGANLLKVILAERFAKGWGIAELEEFNEEKSLVIIKVRDLFECMLLKGMYKEPHSYFFKGYLTGLLRELFNKEIKVIEEKCVAKGDEYCLFVTRI